MAANISWTCVCIGKLPTKLTAHFTPKFKLSVWSRMLKHRNDRVTQTWVANPCLGLMSSSQADSGEPRLKLSTDKECRSRNTKDNLGKSTLESGRGWYWKMSRYWREHPSIMPPNLPARSHDWRARATGSRKAVWTIFWSIPVLRPTFFGCCFRLAGWWGTAPTLPPRVTTPHQLLSQVQCVNLQNSQKSPEKGNNWSRPIIGQTRPNFFENCPITFQPVLASHDFQKKDKTHVGPDSRNVCRGPQPKNYNYSVP